ncbi:MAG: DUF2079 domain-containing protein [Candidatus Levybacteria bacterium]|nr:DUF2079 domain-containing protein [Candidatus Levybacteria bacterium]MBI2622581.1 DUF2079 domain-containing protein [Candidatus Levybacteria bacterium]
MNRLLPLIKLFLGWPISLLALIFIFRLIIAKGEIVFPNISEINFPLFFLGILILLFYFFLRSFFWQQILKEKGYKIPFTEVAWLWAASEFKRYAPGKIWLFLGRAMLFSRYGIKNKDIFAALFIEVSFLVLSSILLSLFSLPLIIKVIPFFQFMSDPLIFFLLLFLIAVGTLLFIFNARFAKKINLKSPLYILPDFPPNVNVRLLLISLIFMSLFGLGVYITILAVVPFPGTPIGWTSFFVFAFLIGYLSFVTPMGLGIREGAITLGLSKFIMPAAAGMLSIYSRIILIFVEFIFLAFAFFFSRSKKLFFQKSLNWLQAHKSQVILIFFIFLYIIYFTTASFLRHENFYSGRYDLGNMDQVVWNTSQGRIFQASSDENGGLAAVSRLSAHADFILILISPLYLLWSDPRMLLFLQTLILALGAVFVFLLAKKITGREGVGLLFSVLYLLNPHIQHANLYDFHAVTFATTFLLGAFYFLIEKKYGWFLLLAILSGLAKEQIWLIIALFGAYIFVFAKKRLFGTAVFLTSLGLFYFLIWQIMPNARGAQHFALSYYSDFGDSPTMIVKNVLFSPDKIFETLLLPDRRDYLYQLFLPLGFLPFLSPLSLLFALPDILIKLLSSNANLRQIYYHYTAVITPFLFIGAIFGIKNLQRMFPKLPLLFYSLCLILTTLYAAYSFGPLPWAKNPNIDMFIKPQPNREIIKNLLPKIPNKYSVAATNNLGSHLSSREKIFTIPVGVDKADILVFLLNDTFAQPSLKAQKEMAEKLKDDKDYVLVFEKDDFVVFKKQGVELSFFD